VRSTPLHAVHIFPRNLHDKLLQFLIRSRNSLQWFPDHCLRGNV